MYHAFQPLGNIFDKTMLVVAVNAIAGASVFAAASVFKNRNVSCFVVIHGSRCGVRLCIKDLKDLILLLTSELFSGVSLCS